MAKPVFYPAHFLEGSTVTVTGEELDPAFSKNNLSDRDIRMVWKDDSFTGTRVITGEWVSLEPVPAVDTWIIPEQHGLVNLDLSLESSDDGVAWDVRDTVMPSTTALVKRPIPGGPYTHPWWRLQMAGATAAPYLAELFITKGVMLPFSTSYDGGDGQISEVVRRMSPGGAVRKSKRWGPIWNASYTIADIDEPDWEPLMTQIFSVLDARFCYLDDVDGHVRYVELLEPAWMGGYAPISRRDLTLALQAVA